MNTSEIWLKRELCCRLYEERELNKARIQFQAKLADYEKYAALAGLGLGAAHEMPRDISPTGHRFLSLREWEDDYIRRASRARGNNQTPDARILDIHPTSLLRGLKKSK